MDRKNNEKKGENPISENDQVKKRFEEIKQSNDLMNSKSASGNFYVPKRKSSEVDNEEVALIKPRKKKNLPFSDEKKREFEETMTIVQKGYKDNLKQQKIVEKKLVKEEARLSKMISKMNRKIGSLVDKEDDDGLEKTVEIQEQYLNALDKVNKEINTMILNENNASLEDRRRYIYNKAYNAETERARRLVGLRNDNRAAWTNQVKEEKKKTSKRNGENWMERLGLNDEE